MPPIDGIGSSADGLTYIVTGPTRFASFDVAVHFRVLTSSAYRPHLCLPTIGGQIMASCLLQ